MKSVLEQLLEFDPNSQPQWGVYTPGRWRTFAKRQYALGSSAFGRMTSYVRLFEQVDGKWVERARRINAMQEPICDICGGSTEGHDAWNQKTDLGVWHWKRDRNRRIVEPLVNMFVCRQCERLLP